MFICNMPFPKTANPRGQQSPKCEPSCQSCYARDTRTSPVCNYSVKRWPPSGWLIKRKHVIVAKIKRMLTVVRPREIRELCLGLKKKKYSK